MFEIEKMEKEFDYSLVDNETADFLRSCEYEMNGIAEDARIKFGAVLKKAQDRLAKSGHGFFLDWVESGGISKDDAYYYINLYHLSINLERQKKDNFLSAPKSLQKEIMKKNVPEELKQAVLEGEIKTHKEYKELVKKLEEVERVKQQLEQNNIQLEQEKLKLGQLLTEERNKPQETVTVEVEKEVIIDNTDHETINELKDELNKNKNRLEFLEKQKKLLEERLTQEENDANEYRNLKEELKLLHSEKDDLFRQINSATSISELYVDIEDLLQNKLAPIKYSRAITESRDSKIAMNNLKEIIQMVDEWSNEMKTYLPNENSNIIEAEVIEYN